MSEEYGNDYITIEDDEGNEFALEHLDTIEFENQTYMAFLPADSNEEDEDYGIIILKVIEENGEEVLATVDDDNEAQKVYEYYMELVLADDTE